MKKIKEKYLAMRDRQVYLTPNYWNGISQTHPQTIKHHGANPKVYLNLFDNGRMVAYYYKKLWDRAARHISKRLQTDEKYYQKIKNKMLIREAEARALIKKLRRANLKELNFGRLVALANNIFSAWLEYDMLNVPPWFWGGDQFKELVRKNLNINDQDLAILTTPDAKTWASQMEFDLARYTNLIKKNKLGLKKAAGKLAGKYAHLPFGYDGLEYWDKDYFAKKLTGLIKKYSVKKEIELNRATRREEQNKKRKEEIIKKHKFSQEQLGLINKINELAVWTDERKELHYLLHYYYAQILLELGERHNIPYKNLKFLFIEELKKIADSGEKLLEITNQRINDVFFLRFINGQAKILSPKEKDRILKEIAEQNNGIIDIKGMVASRGPKDKYIAKVKILLSPREANKIQKGDFLVTTMTTPDYILAMKKAAGFITDEGGVTCHAAIVGREMNKPCIIGTKIATQILKDGDLVEVDAERGIVRKI